jgi:hypothetical protein
MPAKKHFTASKSTDPDDAPSLDRDWFERAEIREGDSLVRRAKIGRPKKDAPSGQHSARPRCAGPFPRHRPRLAIADQRGAPQGGEGVN